MPVQKHDQLERLLQGKRAACPSGDKLAVGGGRSPQLIFLCVLSSSATTGGKDLHGVICFAGMLRAPMAASFSAPTLAGDEELDTLIKATIAGGGVIPHIHKSLINKAVKKDGMRESMGGKARACQCTLRWASACAVPALCSWITRRADCPVRTTALPTRVQSRSEAADAAA